MPRVICLVADGLGVGEAPDAKKYGDEGSNTLAHTAEAVGGIRLPTLEKLGLGNIGDFPGIKRVSNPSGWAGKMAERSEGKDTTTGHWELAGVITAKPMATFPDGFPKVLLDEFISAAKVPGILGNKAASGTAIIDELGEEHVKTGKPIVYTSADSVFQVACHEETFGLERLQEICRLARELTMPYQIGRVISRPFIGSGKGNFQRTENRRDFALPPDKNCLDLLYENGVPVISVGKIEDIFAHRAISAGNHTGNNRDSLKASLDYLQKNRGKSSFIFTNLVDFDMLYGHRRDPVGYARALSELDEFLPKILGELEEGDALLLTADHGCDPTFRGTDHTREYVPLVVHAPGTGGGSLGVRESFGDVAAFLLEKYGIGPNTLPGVGKSFLCQLRN